MSDFSGFPVTALDFYDDLEVDNTKSFWEANKAVYTEAVKAPMEALTGALAAEFGTAKVFRPYRDVRFAKDKTPYKTHQGAFVRVGPRTGWYVEVSARGDALLALTGVALLAAQAVLACQIVQVLAVHLGLAGGRAARDVGEVLDLGAGRLEQDHRHLAEQDLLGLRVEVATHGGIGFALRRGADPEKDAGKAWTSEFDWDKEDKDPEHVAQATETVLDYFPNCVRR